MLRRARPDRDPSARYSAIPNEQAGSPACPKARAAAELHLPGGRNAFARSASGCPRPPNTAPTRANTAAADCGRAPFPNVLAGGLRLAGPGDQKHGATTHEQRMSAVIDVLAAEIPYVQCRKSLR